MNIFLKHRKSGKLYERNGFSSSKGWITTKFRTVHKYDGEFEELTVTTEWVENPEQYDFCKQSKLYHIARKKNDDAHEADISNIFEAVFIGDDIHFQEVPKYIKVEMKMNCPFCGSPMKATGEVLMSYPAQYPHVCTNSECGYSMYTSGYSVGEVYYGTSVEEVESILLHGTDEEIEDLKKRKRMMKMN